MGLSGTPVLFHHVLILQDHEQNNKDKIEARDLLEPIIQQTANYVKCSMKSHKTDKNFFIQNSKYH